MKLFRNIREDGVVNYATSFFSNKDGKQLKKALYASFNRGSEPLIDKNSYEMELKAVIDGEWFDVSLGAYTNKKGEIEGKMWLKKCGMKEKEPGEDNFAAQTMVEYLHEDEDEPEQLKINEGELPFY